MPEFIKLDDSVVYDSLFFDGLAQERSCAVREALKETLRRNQYRVFDAAYAEEAAADAVYRALDADLMQGKLQDTHLHFNLYFLEEVSALTADRFEQLARFNQRICYQLDGMTAELHPYLVISKADSNDEESCSNFCRVADELLAHQSGSSMQILLQDEVPLSRGNAGIKAVAGFAKLLSSDNMAANGLRSFPNRRILNLSATSFDLAENLRTQGRASELKKQLNAEEEAVNWGDVSAKLMECGNAYVHEVEDRWSFSAKKAPIPEAALPPRGFLARIFGKARQQEALDEFSRTFAGDIQYNLGDRAVSETDRTYDWNAALETLIGTVPIAHWKTELHPWLQKRAFDDGREAIPRARCDLMYSKRKSDLCSRMEEAVDEYKKQMAEQYLQEHFTETLADLLAKRCDGDGIERQREAYAAELSRLEADPALGVTGPDQYFSDLEEIEKQALALMYYNFTGCEEYLFAPSSAEKKWAGGLQAIAPRDVYAYGGDDSNVYRSMRIMYWEEQEYRKNCRRFFRLV